MAVASQQCWCLKGIDLDLNSANRLLVPEHLTVETTTVDLFTGCQISVFVIVTLLKLKYQT